MALLHLQRGCRAQHLCCAGAGVSVVEAARARSAAASAHQQAGQCCAICMPCWLPSTPCPALSAGQASAHDHAGRPGGASPPAGGPRGRRPATHRRTDQRAGGCAGHLGGALPGAARRGKQGGVLGEPEELGTHQMFIACMHSAAACALEDMCVEHDPVAACPALRCACGRQGCQADPIVELEAWQRAVLGSLPAARPTSPPPLQHVSAIIVQLYAHRVRQLPLTGPAEPR